MMLEESHHKVVFPDIVTIWITISLYHLRECAAKTNSFGGLRSRIRNTDNLDLNYLVELIEHEVDTVARA